MALMQARGASRSRRDRSGIGSVLLCIVGGIALAIAVISWAGLCQDGTHSSCRNGTPSFELVFQFALAVGGCAATFVARYFFKRRASAPRRAAVAVSLLLLGSWVLVVDAATNGWEDLQVWTVLLTTALIFRSFALTVALLRRTH